MPTKNNPREKYSMTYNLGLLQKRAYNVLDRQLSKTLESHRLTMTEWKLLGKLFDHEDLTFEELADKVEADISVIKNSVVQLKEKKMVVYGNGNQKPHATITILGEKTIETIEKDVTQLLDKLFNSITPVQRMLYTHILQTIVKNEEL